jgi:hypothetical protein
MRNSFLGRLLAPSPEKHRERRGMGLKCKLKTHVSGELAYFLKTNFRFGIAVFGGTLHGKILENLLILAAHYGVK